MNNLQEVYNSYRISSDNHKVVIKLLNEDPKSFPENIDIASLSISDAKESLDSAYTELQDLTIVSLIAIFEKIIIKHIFDICIKDSSLLKDEFSKTAMEYVTKLKDRWSLMNILDIYKSIVSSNVVGEIKQIIEYRNWVAHGKKNNKPLSLSPEIAYQRLSAFIKQADL